MRIVIEMDQGKISSIRSDTPGTAVIIDWEGVSRQADFNDLDDAVREVVQWEGRGWRRMLADERWEVDRLVYKYQLF